MTEPDTELSPVPESDDARDYSLSRDVVEGVLEALEAQDGTALAALLDPLHPADIADLMEQVGDRNRRRLLHFWARDIDGEVLSELDESIRDEVFETLPDEVLGDAVRDLDSDDVVDLVEDLEPAQRDAILARLDAPERAAVEQALRYPEYSAGRLMQREVVYVPEDWTVGSVIDHVRADKKRMPEQFYHVILVDPKMRPTGYVTLGKILSTPRKRPLAEITEDSFRTVRVTQQESEVAYAFNQYHLISMPVVDEDDRLVGVITIDDAMAVLDEEHEEDILRLAGVSDESSLSDRVIDTTRRRLPWLAVNLVTAILASLVIAEFDQVIAQVVALAVLMPIVASMGGNAGTQSLTVAVRAIATKDLTGSNIWRVLRREVLVGLINGLAFAVIMGVVALIWFGSPMIGWVIAVAMVINLVVAGLAGIGIPFLLDKLKIDPALASGAFVTTVTDVVGFFAFLGLAAAVLI